MGIMSTCLSVHHLPRPEKDIRLLGTVVNKDGCELLFGARNWIQDPLQGAASALTWSLFNPDL